MAQKKNFPQEVVKKTSPRAQELHRILALPCASTSLESFSFYASNCFRPNEAIYGLSTTEGVITDEADVFFDPSK